MPVTAIIQADTDRNANNLGFCSADILLRWVSRSRAAGGRYGSHVRENQQHERNQLRRRLGFTPPARSTRSMPIPGQVMHGDEMYDRGRVEVEVYMRRTWIAKGGFP